MSDDFSSEATAHTVPGVISSCFVMTSTIGSLLFSLSFDRSVGGLRFFEAQEHHMSEISRKTHNLSGNCHKHIDMAQL